MLAIRLVVAVRVLISTDRLVGVRRLLGGKTATVVVFVVIGRSAGAAAHTESPEDGGSEREGDGDPGCDINVLAESQLNTVRVQGLSKATTEDRENHCRSDGGGGGEEETDQSEDGGDTAAPSAADSKETNENFDDGDNERDQVCNEHPLGHILVDVDDLVIVVRQFLLNAGAVQAPNSERVEVELGLRLGALRDGVDVVLDVARAVAPETDIVEVLEGTVILEVLDQIGDLL